MWTDEQFEELEQEEHSLTEEAIIAVLLNLTSTKGDLEKEIRNIYQKYGKDGVVTYSEMRKWVSEKDHRRRLTVLYLFVADLFDTSFDSFEANFKNHLKEIVLKEARFFDVEIDVDEILELTWGVDDLNWYDRLWSYRNKWTNTLCSDFKRSFLKRDSIMDVLNILEKRVVTMNNILRKLYVTETTAVGSLARREIFKELDIKKYRYYAREDERTCEVCGSLHGLEFPVSSYEIGVNASPMHPWCRCWEVPVVD